MKNIFISYLLIISINSTAQGLLHEFNFDGTLNNTKNTISFTGTENYVDDRMGTPKGAQRISNKSIQAIIDDLSLNHGDVFILDAGLQIYIFIGEKSNAFEKMKGGALAHNLVAARQGKSKLCTELDDNFWRILGGTFSDIQPVQAHEEDQEDRPIELDKLKLFRLSDADGEIKFTKEHEGKLTKAMFDTNDVFIVDANIELFVWIGQGSSKREKSSAMKFADTYLRENNKPTTTPITCITEGQVHHVFGALIK